MGVDSAGQSGDPQGLSDLEEANDESVEELAQTDLAYEASIVEGVEDAGDHPGRQVHTHEEYGRQRICLRASGVMTLRKGILGSIARYDSESRRPSVCFTAGCCILVIRGTRDFNVEESPYWWDGNHGGECNMFGSIFLPETGFFATAFESESPEN